MSTNFDDYLKDQLKDPEFRKEYEALLPEQTLIQAFIDARCETGLTQKQLSDLTGIAQGDICKLEKGKSNPSIRTLQKLAKGMGRVLRIEFVPEDQVFYG